MPRAAGAKCRSVARDVAACAGRPSRLLLRIYVLSCLMTGHQGFHISMLQVCGQNTGNKKNNYIRIYMYICIHMYSIYFYKVFTHIYVLNICAIHHIFPCTSCANLSCKHNAYTPHAPHTRARAHTHTHAHINEQANAWAQHTSTHTFKYKYMSSHCYYLWFISCICI